jgi:hypothetical protein
MRGGSSGIGQGEWGREKAVGHRLNKLHFLYIPKIASLLPVSDR